MASLLTDAEKTTCNNAMDDLHDTFARDVYVYKDAVITVSTPSQSYNTIYGNAGATTPIAYTPQVSTVSARLLYGKNYTEDYFSSSQSNSQLKIFLPEGQVRMIFKAADYSTLSQAKRIVFDAHKFAIDSDFRGHGVFGVKFYTIYLKYVS